MLWNQIYEFFVIHVFGGVLSSEGGSSYYLTYFADTTDSYSVFLSVFGQTIRLPNYLAFIATIITMVAILLFCVFIIKKIIGIIFRLFTGSSAF